MKTGRMMAGALAVAALVVLGVGAASAQPREDKSKKAPSTQDVRVQDDDFGPGDCPCPMCGGPGFGPGMHARGMRGAGFHGNGPCGHGGPGSGMRGRGPGARMGGGGYGMGPGFGGMGFGRGMGLLAGGGRLAKELNLTDAQLKKMDAIREEHRRSMIKARADMELARMDLAKLLRDDAAGVAATEQQIDRIAQMQSSHWKSMATSFRAARDVLTAKQREQLRNMRPSWRDMDDDKESQGKPPTR